MARAQLLRTNCLQRHFPSVSDCLLLGLPATQLVAQNMPLISKDLNLFCHAYLALTRNNLFMDLLIVFLFCVHERNYVSGVKGFDSLLESIPSLCTRPCCLYNKCLSFHFISLGTKTRDLDTLGGRDLTPC